MAQYRVHAEFDSAARRWIVTKSDIVGLAAAADTVEELIAFIEEAAPALLRANKQLPDPGPGVPFELIAARQGRLQMAAA